MPDEPAATPPDIFTNVATREAGFTDTFWQQAHALYEADLRRNPPEMFGNLERTVRAPFRDGHVDVYVRYQPEMSEYPIMRLTAYPAGDGAEPEPVDIYTETRPRLGEARVDCESPGFYW